MLDRGRPTMTSPVVFERLSDPIARGLQVRFGTSAHELRPRRCELSAGESARRVVTLAAISPLTDTDTDHSQSRDEEEHVPVSDNCRAMRKGHFNGPGSPRPQSLARNPIAHIVHARHAPTPWPRKAGTPSTARAPSSAPSSAASRTSSPRRSSEASSSPAIPPSSTSASTAGSSRRGARASRWRPRLRGSSPRPSGRPVRRDELRDARRPNGTDGIRGMDQCDVTRGHQSLTNGEPPPAACTVTCTFTV
jgi:hypothetical protein